MDSVQHNFIVSGDSVALRGGTVSFENPADGVVEWTLDAAHFTDDVAVSGTFSAVGPDYSGDFAVTGPGGWTRTVSISGPFLTDGEDMTITFAVDGRPATFTVPAY
jgi:hypothetical protein